MEIIDPSTNVAAATALSAFRAVYAESLREPRGWWSVCGLAFVDAEVVSCGSAGAVVLPARYGAEVAQWWRDGDRLIVEGDVWVGGVRRSGAIAVAENEAVRFGPDPMDVEALVMRRAERLALRLFDPLQGAARPVSDVAWFATPPGFVVRATLAAAQEGATIPVVNMLGYATDTPLAGTLHFALAGVERSLLATRKPDGGLFVHYRDATSGVETYGAGRFLSVVAERGGETVIDFHRSIQPPCFHTPFATCPMPPLPNRLDVAVRVGERNP